MNVFNLRITWLMYKELKARSKLHYTSMTGYARAAIAERLKKNHLITIDNDQDEKKVSVSIYLPDDLRDIVMSIADRSGVTPSDVIRSIVNNKLKEKKNENTKQN